MSRVEGHIEYNEAEGGPFDYNEKWIDYNGNGIHGKRSAVRVRDEFDRWIVVTKRSG